MNLIDTLKNIITGYKKLPIKNLPTQGFFYPEDFEIKIKRAENEDIINYEMNFDEENVITIIELLKHIVKKNTSYSKNYTFNDLKSVDIVYIFLEIVKFTQGKKIEILTIDDKTGELTQVEFSEKTFAYFDFNNLSKNYIKESCEFIIDGYRFSMPSIGVENSLTKFLMSLLDREDKQHYNDYSFDFIFFLGRKNHLTFDEIENLILIFNSDIDDSEKVKIKSIIDKFIGMVDYKLLISSTDLKSNLDLKNIWKE